DVDLRVLDGEVPEHEHHRRRRDDDVPELQARPDDRSVDDRRRRLPLPRSGVGRRRRAAHSGSSAPISSSAPNSSAPPRVTTGVPTAGPEEIVTVSAVTSLIATCFRRYVRESDLTY